ncbi:Telomeric repeat-binding factor 2 [compost metagenome]
MRKTSLGILLLALLLLVTACGGVASTSTGTQNANNSVKDQQGPAENVNNEQAGDADAAEPTKEPEEPKEVAYKVGDKFNLGNWEVVLDSFEFNQKVSDEYFSSSADEGNKFLILNYTVTNEGTEADNFTSMIGGVEMKALFQDKYEYTYTITMIDKDLSKESIKPLSSKTGFVVMEVPDTVAKSEDGLILKLAKDKAKATINLR